MEYLPSEGSEVQTPTPQVASVDSQLSIACAPPPARVSGARMG